MRQLSLSALAALGILVLSACAGGAVTSADGAVKVEGPSGVSVTKVTASELTGMDLKEDGLLAYSFGPAGALSSPATVTMTLPVGLMIPSFWHVSEKGFEPVENLAIVTDGKTATATFTLTHFSGIIVNTQQALFTILASPGLREVDVGDAVPYLFKVQATENLVVISQTNGRVIAYYQIKKGSRYTVNKGSASALAARNGTFTPQIFELPQKTLPVNEQYRAIRAFTCTYAGMETIEFSKPLIIEYEEDYSYPLPDSVDSVKGTNTATVSLSFSDKYICKEKSKNADGSMEGNGGGLQIRVKGLEKYEQH